MPDIVFIQEEERGFPNEKIILSIPESGPMPDEIPFTWDGEKATISSVVSGFWRLGWKGDRSYDAVETNKATLAWIPERLEWIAFEVTREYSDTGIIMPGQYRDETVTLKGPWSIDKSHGEAILKAFKVTALDASQVRTISPSELKNKYFYK